MTFIITALENTRAKLIASDTYTTDEELAKIIIANLEARGFLVVVKEEN